MSLHSHEHSPVAPTAVVDPVCGMTISPHDAVGQVDHNHQTYSFCSQRCLDQFRTTPDAFLGTPAETVATATNMDSEYTCPTDPDVRQQGHGTCPKSGMALETLDARTIMNSEWTCPMHP